MPPRQPVGARHERPDHPRPPPRARRRRCRSSASRLVAPLRRTTRGQRHKTAGAVSRQRLSPTDSWIRIDADSGVPAFTGKARARPGFQDRFPANRRGRTRHPPSRRSWSSLPDTKLTANEGYTAGSHSMQDSGTAIQNAAAQVRALLIGESGEASQAGGGDSSDEAARWSRRTDD